MAPVIMLMCRLSRSEACNFDEKLQPVELVTTTVVLDVRIPLLIIMIQRRPLTTDHVSFQAAPFLKHVILIQMRQC